MSAKHPNAATIERFYEAFARLDAETMVSCYAPDAHFSDAVFVDLKGDEIFAMWRMLAKRAKEFQLTFRDVSADDATGKAHWEATYLFSKTGRKVRNVIDADFAFSGGKIVAHQDRFDLWKWAGMALGAPGKVLGWTPMMQGKIRGEARKGLEEFMKGR
jgi:hypothetical protein